jgi:hypothetical protein
MCCDMLAADQGPRLLSGVIASPASHKKGAVVTKTVGFLSLFLHCCSEFRISETG